MRDYSFRYLDARGRSGPSDFLKFADEASAIGFARAGLDSHAIVEVWRGSVLLLRLDRAEAGLGKAVVEEIDAPAIAAIAPEHDEPGAASDFTHIVPMHGRGRPIR